MGRIFFWSSLLIILFLNAPGRAEAFCGFYASGAGEALFNDATHVVLMRDGTRTVLSMQNHYEGPLEDFAMIVPVPVVLGAEDVQTLPDGVFERVDAMSAPRLVEYWEVDPCYKPRRRASGGAMAAAPEMGHRRGVEVEARFEVGEYEVVVLSAADAMDLHHWLLDERYAVPQDAGAALRPYVDAGMKFFVAKVNIDRVKRGAGGRVKLSPLRFFYDSDTFSLPVRLGLLNSRGMQDLIINILAPGQRYEVANAPNVTIPTNIEVHPEVKPRFGEFYAALFDETVRRHPGAVVTEYAWRASTCDPCPGQVLQAADFEMLGADVMVTPPRDLVLTRLHARYAPATFADDLIFKAAPSISGGVEGMGDGAESSGVNQFQGRYVIRHEWDEPIECEQPRRGLWGRPSASESARETAFAPRGAFELARAVGEDIDALGVETKAPISHPEGVSERAPSRGWCGCRQSRRSGGGSPWAIGALLFGLWVLRRGSAARS